MEEELRAKQWYGSLVQEIDNNINTNGSRSITGAKLNGVLNDMVSALGSNMLFGGAVTPSDSKDASSETPVFYFASQAGTYTNFGNIVVAEGEFAFIYADINNNWHKMSWSVDISDVYVKPDGGIPKTDLSSAVQTSLGKADTAIQTETDPTVPSWAKQESKPIYTAGEVGAIASTEKGANGGVATLDSGGKVPQSQLPSYVDDVLEYNSIAQFPATGESGKIYVAVNTNKTYRWSGSAYVEIAQGLALGETSSTAFAGNRGKAIEDKIPSNASSSNKLATMADLPDGTTDYSDLNNKPQINSVTLGGNKSASDLGLATAAQGAKADTAYQKPQSGIPSTDLASGVQTSLGKADTAVQQVTVGTTTTGAAGTNASVTNRGTSTAPVLDFTIPRGADAVNPFKGYFDSLSDLQAKYPIGETGYFANVYDSTADKTYRYVWDASLSTPAWVQALNSSSQPIEVTPSTAIFATGQSVIDTSIVNDFTTGGSANVASAETVKTLNQDKIDKVEVISENITYENVSMEDDPASGYITAAGTFKTPSSNYVVAVYPVTSGKTYKIKGRSATAHSFYYFYDENDSPLTGGSPSSTSPEEVEVVAPSGSTYVRVESFSSDISSGYNYVKEKIVTIVTKNNQEIIDSVGDVSELETTEKQTVVGAINEVAGAVNEMGDVSGAVQKINAISETVVSPNMFDKSAMINGYINSSSGNVASSSSSYKMSDYIPVLPNHYYYLSGRTSNKVIICLNADKSEIMKVLAASNGETVSTYTLPNVEATTNAVNGQFKTPSNAAYVQFNVIFSNGDSADNVMLTDVGDTYNPDYIVPAYQPYGTSTKVKSSAIDCDDTPVKDSEKPITSRGVYEALQGITPQTEVGKKLKVLLIGSSHGVNTISMFPALCKGAGIDIVCGNLYSGSATIGNTPSSVSPNVQIPYKARFNNAFERFAVYENGEWRLQTTKTLQYALQNYKWDVVIVQRGNSEVTVWNDAMDGYLQYLLDYIKDNCVINGMSYTPTIYFNSGIANGSSYGTTTQVTTTTNIIATAETMKSRWGIDVIPVAIALQYARKTILHTVGAWNPTDGGTAPDLTYDGQHLDTGVGQYVMACCVFEKVVKDFFNMSVREVDYIPVYSDISGNTTNATEAYFTPITEYYSRIGKTCAALACIDGEYNTDTVTYLQSRFGAEPVQYNVTYNLTNCSLNDTRSTIMSDDVYMANFTSNSGYTLDISTVNVLMNEVDVTSNVLVNNSTNSIVGIRIGEITGNIVITATAQQN